ncbi:hypothetical protein B296_00025962 [Ensete ventricosum]|uniref:Uncharacterized protein n=1 Tax=Ensete ventricosum TaxID=4639 RepID=A0A426Z8Q3_ENSVE|nr:hypothetical protein B296_00025962 [Ensete ventricosum]
MAGVRRRVSVSVLLRSISHSTCTSSYSHVLTSFLSFLSPANRTKITSPSQLDVTRPSRRTRDRDLTAPSDAEPGGDADLNSPHGKHDHLLPPVLHRSQSSIERTLLFSISPPPSLPPPIYDARERDDRCLRRLLPTAPPSANVCRHSSVVSPFVVAVSCDGPTAASDLLARASPIRFSRLLLTCFCPDSDERPRHLHYWFLPIGYE